ncbi:MAG TPA: hypothetical protein VL992_10835 [Tepidisphaeraceae bacterium]|nr:hypothetical protein [Tepidisphaeraceae bacterium]
MKSASAINLVIAGRAEAADPQMDLFSAAARSAVRYADPLCWTAATAVARALRGLNDCGRQKRHATGVITISPHGPAQTIAAVAEASAAGSSSPLRYPASNPGALAGIVCIMHDLRGPTLNFVTPAAVALPPAAGLAESWIAHHGLPLVVILVSGRVDRSKYPARCLLLAADQPGEPMNPDHLAWLAAA